MSVERTYASEKCENNPTGADEQMICAMLCLGSDGSRKGNAEVKV